MYTFLLTILIIDALILGTAVLLQAGKGGGLAASFGGASSSSDSLLGTRQAGNILTKTSWWAGGIFIGLAFVLQLMSARSRVPTSILDQAMTPSAQTAPSAAPAAEPSAQSAVPLEPAPTTPTTPPQP
ncbi:MAG TPA: preprotein translocase subunit SecG [Gemmatimonadaceae bacterium]|nr:preprotein translocase subunit SecG [Gemmatimonadaceae bacterium]HRQ78301.1 preprotein translocase subunit SecG [Gemmatimonadaceae bacterium]